MPLDRREASGEGGGEARGSKGRRRRKRRKVGLITSCIFKQAHSPCGKESSIFGRRRGEHVRKRETRGDRRMGGKEGELVSEVEVRSCWADAGGVMGEENDGGSERGSE